MRGKAHDAETKAQVLAALLAGQGVTEVAGTYHLPETTIRQWAKDLGPQFVEVRAKKTRDFDELVAGYLEQVLVTLSVQAQQFRDPAWVSKQSAADAAVLHGVMADKAIRILSAAQPAPGPSDSPPDTGTGV